MNIETPPRWAEWLLRSVVTREHRDNVSGDLLEEYRDVVVPARGRRRADLWFLAQVGGYVARHAWVWALLFAGAFLVRQAYDMSVPATDFHLRSAVTTYTAIALVSCAGFSAGWRSGSLMSGAVAGIATTAIAAPFSIAGAVVLLASWHDPAHLANAGYSGGVDEMFILPVLAIVPGAILGLLAAIVGAAARAMAAAARA